MWQHAASLLPFLPCACLCSTCACLCSHPAPAAAPCTLQIDACKRASARSITAVLPYFGYARADRKTQVSYGEASV